MSKKIPSNPLNFAAFRAINSRILAFFAMGVAVLALGIPLILHAADPTTAELYGVWRLEETSGLVCNLEFRKDGVFVSDVSRKGKAIGNFAGQWSLRNGSVLYTYTKSTVKQIPVGSKDQDHIAELTPEYVDLQSEKGGVKRYFRVSEK